MKTELQRQIERLENAKHGDLMQFMLGLSKGFTRGSVADKNWKNIHFLCGYKRGQELQGEAYEKACSDYQSSLNRIIQG